jgi:hypothetical protein
MPACFDLRLFPLSFSPSTGLFIISFFSTTFHAHLTRHISGMLQCNAGNAGIINSLTLRNPSATPQSSPGKYLPPLSTL